MSETVPPTQVSARFDAERRMALDTEDQARREVQGVLERTKPLPPHLLLRLLTAQATADLWRRVTTHHTPPRGRTTPVRLSDSVMTVAASVQRELLSTAPPLASSSPLEELLRRLEHRAKITWLGRVMRISVGRSPDVPS